MALTQGKVRTSTGVRNPNHPITAIRPVYDDAGLLIAVRVEVEALFDNGSFQEVGVDLLPLLTPGQRTTLAGVLAAIAIRTRAYLS